MVAIIPKGVYTMKDRFVIINENAKTYQKASKKVKSRILNELTHILQMNRQYLAGMLARAGKIITRTDKFIVVADPTLHELSKRGRKKLYTEEVLIALKKIWPLTGFSSSKHLVAFIRLNHEILFSHPELKDFLTDRTKQLLLRISHATVDRMLKPYRDKLKLKKRYRSNPFSSNLKKSIKVESWFDKPKEPGYVEIDLVHHCGASGKGEFIYTLTATEVATGWTELRAIKNKAMVWTKEALTDIIKTMPLPVKKIHSDNGSEFLNAHVQRFCKEKGIEFTRSRPYRKNDAPYVESRNWSLVRAYVGWRRYDTEQELRILDKLLKLITIRHNLFMPHMKLISRERYRGKIKRQYEMNTPLQRVLKLIQDEENKDKLNGLRQIIDIVRLSIQIERLTEQLSLAYENKLRKLNHAKS